MGFRSSRVVLGLLGVGNNGCRDNSCSQEDQVGDMQPHYCGLVGEQPRPAQSSPAQGLLGLCGGTHWQVPGKENQMFPEGVLFSLLSSLLHPELSSSSSSAPAATLSILLLMESLSLPAPSGCSSRPPLPHACCPSLPGAGTWADSSPPARRAAPVAQSSPYQ